MDNMDEVSEIIVENEEACNKVLQFIENIANLNKTLGSDIGQLHHLPCDEPLKGLRGYYVFSPIETGEEGLLISWRHAKPIEKVNVYKFTEDRKQDLVLSDLMTSCIKNGWVRCDNPKDLMVGWLDYELSVVNYFDIRFFRYLTPMAKAAFEESEKKKIELENLPIELPTLFI
jgi:hypothetical protein